MISRLTKREAKRQEQRQLSRERRAHLETLHELDSRCGLCQRHTTLEHRGPDHAVLLNSRIYCANCASNGKVKEKAVKS